MGDGPEHIPRRAHPTPRTHSRRRVPTHWRGYYYSASQRDIALAGGQDMRAGVRLRSRVRVRRCASAVIALLWKRLGDVTSLILSSIFWFRESRFEQPLGRIWRMRIQSAMALRECPWGSAQRSMPLRESTWGSAWRHISEFVGPTRTLKSVMARQVQVAIAKILLQFLAAFRHMSCARALGRKGTPTMMSHILREHCVLTSFY